ncbi:hypothetical protein LTR17_008544 [Elasticomyces elasticus]|nr:hypothetical protein LTR17_008544 [Elasticomyces elasticus]
MLDPLSALSLAAALVQFIDFTGTVVSNAHQMHKAATGASKANFDIEKLVSTLQGLTVDLAPSSTVTLAGLPPNEQKLYAIAAECRKLSEEIIVFLQELKISSHGRSRAFVAIRQSIRATFKADKTEAMMKTLDRLQIELNTALLLVVRDDQSTAMAHLQSLSRRAKGLSADAASQLEATRVGLLAALERQNTELQRVSTKLDQNHTALLRTYVDTQESVRLLSSRLHDVVNIGDSTDRSTRVLASLRFNGMFDRQLNIHTNHKDTCHWIFDSDRVPFAQWCKIGSGVFWVSGKAGSGKSTLMRFLTRDARTSQLLQRGTAAKPVVIASYYFWSAGTELQRSQTGLLQSLLFQILRSCPYLIPTACPQRWASPGSLLDHGQPWEHEELRWALYAVVDSPQLDVEFCFLLDGLDEYAGDHYELINDLNEMASSPAIRLCIASRPWNAFQDAYGADVACHIVLENQTHGDIEQYVNGMLLENPRFKVLVQQDGNVRDLVAKIRQRSEGVFLWVFLVVRSLLRGLTERDDLSVLQRRVSELPSELEKLFAQTLNAVDGVYKKQQAQTLLLVMHSRFALPTLAIWHLQRAMQNPHFALSCDFGPLSLKRLLEVQAEAGLRLNSWCRDLLEVRETATYRLASTLWSDGSLQAEHDGFSSITGSNVDTIHRTVRDYLALGDVQQRLHIQAGRDFEPLITLCHLGIAQLTTLDPALRTDWNTKTFFYTCSVILRYARLVELHGRPCPLEILLRLDELGIIFAARDGYEGHWTAQVDSAYTSRHPDGDFVAYTLSHGIKACLQARLNEEPDLLRNATIPYLYFAVRRPWHDERIEKRRFLSQDDSHPDPFYDILRYMLRHGASPDAPSILPATSIEGQNVTILHAYCKWAQRRRLDHWQEVEDFFALAQEDAQAITRRPSGAEALVPNIVRDAAIWKTFIWSTDLSGWGRAPFVQLKRLISPW